MTLELSENALIVLKERYLNKDRQGVVIETPEQLFQRVAKNIAEVDALYGADSKQINILEKKFYKLLSELRFLPNSPTLMNAGNQLQQLSACFVLPVGDSIQEIFESVKNTALIHQSGGGTGFNFSHLRPSGDFVETTNGIASGPVSFMKVFDAATESIKQGGRRRGANMGVLRVDHPDILEFINSKQEAGSLTNFNISVAVTNEFMAAVEKNSDYALINPRTNKPVRRIHARFVFEEIAKNAWSNGDPGLIFIDIINSTNPTPVLGQIESTNPCGEVPLLSYESCNLGSINLTKFISGKKLNWSALAKTIEDSVHFLDNVIDATRYPLPQIKELTKANRKIGLGVMGFADALYLLEIPYDSDKAYAFADKLMAFIKQKAAQASISLAKKRGVFPNWSKSIFAKKNLRLRNATLTCIAPTGTISMIANVSSAIEPVFSLAFVKRVLGGKELSYVNEHFLAFAKKKKFYALTLQQKILSGASIAEEKTIPEKYRKIFITSHELSAESHLRMQAAFQKHVDLGVSKTINLPQNATAEDVKKAFLHAHRLQCKGITVYRNNSRASQVLNKNEKTMNCFKCNYPTVLNGACLNCPKCGFSTCITA